MVNGTVVLSLVGLQGSRCLSNLRVGEGTIRGFIFCMFLVGLDSSPLRISSRLRTASWHQLNMDATVSSKFAAPLPLPRFSCNCRF
jgi:hypothetical protein